MAPKAATPSGPGSQAPAPLKAPSAAQSHFAKLEGQKKNGRAIWWRSFVPKIVTDSSGAEQVAEQGWRRVAFGWQPMLDGPYPCV